MKNLLPALVVKRLSLGLTTLSIGLSLIIPSLAHALSSPVSTFAPTAKVSFTFDDGLASNDTNVAPILAKYGFTGTAYIATACIGSTGTCPANPDASYMTWNQVTDLKNRYGWEIGSHTVDHPCLASNTQPDCPNKSVLTPSQVLQELTDSKNTLASHGFNALSFASPYGDYTPPILAQIAQLYTSHRGFADQGYNSFPYNDYLLYDQQVQAGVSVAKVESYINHAIANKQWLILTFHDVLPKPSTNPMDYQYATTKLDQIAAYVKSQNLPVVNVSNGLATNTPNLLPNGNFDSGIASGWTTDDPTDIKWDQSLNGSMPTPSTSISLTATSRNIHLFSPKVTINPQLTYFIKSYLNVLQNSGGEVGYYVDEYDSSGNWISGQYKSGEHGVFTEDINFEYHPSSQAVAAASLQVIVTANSAIHAYVDNMQWYAEGSVAPPPPPVNLMPNSTFDNGIGGGWTTNDPVDITADNAGNGASPTPQTSIRFQSTNRNVELFSPKITVSSSHGYEIDSYLNLKQISSGVFAYYIDEYDSSGNWISGQYKTDRSAPMNGTVQILYTPSSANVASASLQLIDVANSNTIAYADNVYWYQTK